MIDLFRSVKRPCRFKLPGFFDGAPRVFARPAIGREPGAGGDRAAAEFQLRAALDIGSRSGLSGCPRQ